MAIAPWSLYTVTAPTAEPVSRTEAKAHLRVDTSDDDTYIDTLITVARRRVEADSLHALMTQTLELRLAGFPLGNAVELPLPPLQSVTSVKYTDSDEVTTTVATTVYSTDVYSTPGRVVLKYGQSWPSFVASPSNPVTIRYVAGWTSAGAVPADLRQAVLLLIAQLYEQREPVLTGNAGAAAVVLPLAYDSLIAEWRNRARRW